MSGADLVEALAQTGTGEPKLRFLRSVVEKRPTLTGEQVIAEMVEELRNKHPRVGPGTLEKAQRLLGGAAVKDFLGTPPKNAEEAKMTFLAKQIGEVLAEQISDRQAEAQAQKIGLPDLQAKKKER